MKVRIVVDERERASGIPEILSSLGARVEFSQLDIGDYIVSSEVVVERKTLKDLFISIFDGRLFKQCSELIKNYPKPFLLIEGDLTELSKYTDNPKIFFGTLISLLLNTNLKLLYSADIEDTALALLVLTDHASREKKPTLLIQKPKKTKEIGLQQLYLVSSLPGVGEKIGVRLLESLKTPKAVFSAPTSRLARIEGVGWARALKIRRALDTPFRLEEESEIQQRRLVDSI